MAFITDVTNTVAAIQAARAAIEGKIAERGLQIVWTPEVLSEAMSGFVINLIRVGGDGVLVADTLSWFFKFMMLETDSVARAVERMEEGGYTQTKYGTPVAACSALSALLGLSAPQAHLLANAILAGRKAYQLQQLGITEA